MATLADRSMTAAGSEDVHGFAVMSLPFESGDVLCLRSWFESSFGPPYDSVWHRSASGDWTIYHSVPADVSCPRFVSAASTQTIETPIDVAWTSADALRVRIKDAGLEWDIALGTTAVTRIMNALLAVTPGAILRTDAVLSMMGLVSTALFSAGRLHLHGRFPNRQWFRASPRRVWMVTSSRAMLGGRDFGRPMPHDVQPAIGSVPLPQKGILMAGAVVAEAFAPDRHRAVTLRSAPRART